MRRQATPDDRGEPGGPPVRDCPTISPPYENLRDGDIAVAALTPRGCISSAMSHTLTLSCGCAVYVACHPKTGVAHTRVIEFRGPFCGMRRHDVGVRLSLWELPSDRSRPQPATGEVVCPSGKTDSVAAD